MKSDAKISPEFFSSTPRTPFQLLDVPFGHLLNGHVPHACCACLCVVVSNKRRNHASAELPSENRDWPTPGNASLTVRSIPARNAAPTIRHRHKHQPLLLRVELLVLVLSVFFPTKRAVMPAPSNVYPTAFSCRVAGSKLRPDPCDDGETTLCACVYIMYSYTECRLLREPEIQATR